MVGVGFNQNFQMVVLSLFDTRNHCQYLQYVIARQMTCIYYLNERVMSYNVHIIKKLHLFSYSWFFWDLEGM